jgi:surface antigen
MIEKLMSSKSFASFFDDSAKYSASTDGLAAAVETIKITKAELEKQRKEIQIKKDAQDSQKKQAESTRREFQDAINANSQQQQQFARDKESATSERKRLSAEQARIMWELSKDDVTGSFSTNKGGYPYQKDCPQRIDDYTDRWGVLVCECTSYAAWKVDQRYGIKIKNYGNQAWGWDAKNWPDRLRGRVPMGSKPKTHSVAVWYTGPYGHVAWVEWVNSNGSIHVSEYNVKYGDYSERDIAASKANSLTYIYFGDL